jgi:hypothetical protein
LFNVDDYVISKKTKRYGKIKKIEGDYAYLSRHGYKGRIREELKDLEMDSDEGHWGDVI